MIKKLLPVFLLLLGIGGGIGVGLALRPAPATPESTEYAADAEKPVKREADPAEEQEASQDMDYVKLNNQFIVPVVHDKLVESLVLMSLSLEVMPNMRAAVYEREPKLRDEFLQVLFDHANMGGFDGEFTNSNNMDVLRNALTEVARKVMGSGVNGILITELARQDV